MRDWVIGVVRDLGIAGIGLLMFAENIFPPLPSEMIMPLAGYLSARGEMSFWPAVAAGSLGSLAGATVWYWIGRRVTHSRLCGWVSKHGIWLAMTPKDVDRAVQWFERHGGFSVLFGRLVPVVRTLISVPAGFSRLPLMRFLLLSAVGTAAWTTALAYAGLFLGQTFQEIERYVGVLSWVVIGAAIMWYLYRVARIKALSSSRSP